MELVFSATRDAMTDQFHGLLRRAGNVSGFGA